MLVSSPVAEHGEPPMGERRLAQPTDEPGVNDASRRGDRQMPGDGDPNSFSVQNIRRSLLGGRISMGVEMWVGRPSLPSLGVPASGALVVPWEAGEIAFRNDRLPP